MEVKSFDIPLPYSGCDNTKEINDELKQLGVGCEQIISVIKITVNPDPKQLLNRDVQRVFYRA